MEKQQKRHFTQWSGQFAVASELCKRGYDVAFTMGNSTPLADLMVVSPGQTSFLIDVKGQRGPSFWQVKDRGYTRDDLYYVFVYVPPDKANRYFIMPHREVNRLIKEYSESGVKYDARFGGFNWTSCHSFEDKWDQLPA